MNYNSEALAKVLSGLPSLVQSPKRKVFISYHHENDQYWANSLRSTHSEQYEVFYDNSLDDEVDSDDLDYVHRKIREDYINGSSLTIVLCGAETHKRRFVDWEIYSTLHYEHALLEIVLPTLRPDMFNNIYVPARLNTNVKAGYAHLINWTNDGSFLKGQIEVALNKSKQTRLIDNTMLKMKRNVI